MSQQFDLEKAIAAWRRPFERDRTFHRDDLDELENNLRDRVEAFVASGLSEEAAFAEALRRMGDYGTLEGEYRKVRWDQTKRNETLKSELIWRAHMLRSYLTIALRHLRREKMYAGINVLGLAVAVACVLLVFLYVRHEFSFDAYHEKGDRIYRMVEYSGFVEKQWDAYVQGDPVEVMRSSYTDVEDAVKVVHCGADRVVLEGEVHRDLEMRCTESSLFNIFSFDLVQGDPVTVLDKPSTAVITRSLAERLFKGEDPIGKAIPVRFMGEEQPFEITGLMEDVPENSHFTFDLLLSYETLRSTPMCLHCGQAMYALLKSGADPEDIAKRALAHILEVDGRENVEDVRLEPLREVYFSEVMGWRNGDIRYVYVLSAIAFIVLLIACANHMNLATARSARRVREVGIRKVVGAHRSQVARQFLAEGLLLVMFALPLAILFLLFVLPLFNDLAGSQVVFSWSTVFPLLAASLAVLMVVGLLGGSYPALYLSSFQPIRVLKGDVRGGLSAVALRKTLVVFQFAASVALIAVTIIVLSQLEYMQEKNLGFDADQVVLVRVTEPTLFMGGATLKQEFLRTPGVLMATAGHGMPGEGRFSGRRFGHELEGESGPRVSIIVPTIDADFLETTRIPLIAGRNIKDESGQFGSAESLVNEAAVRALGWASPEEALGKKLAGGVVVGVVPDFHFQSLHHTVEPLMMQQNDGPAVSTIALRIQGEGILGTLERIEQTWKRIAPGEPFEFSFLRDEMNKLYEKEQRAAKVFGIFAGLAILIACLGLFGLVAFTAEQRTKEIGIRKVLGATVSNIVTLLSKDFLKLVLVAFVLAVPVAYYAMSRWLEDFAYRIELGPGVFLLAGSAALVIALATVGVHALRAALAKPVESLRYE